MHLALNPIETARLNQIQWSVARYHNYSYRVSPRLTKYFTLTNLHLSIKALTSVEHWKTTFFWLNIFFKKIFIYLDLIISSHFNHHLNYQLLSYIHVIHDCNSFRHVLYMHLIHHSNLFRPVLYMHLIHHNKAINICDIVITHYYIDLSKPMRGTISQPRGKSSRCSMLGHPCMVIISLSSWPKLSTILF